MVYLLTILLAVFSHEAKAIYSPQSNSITVCKQNFTDAFTNSKFKILYGIVQTAGRYSSLVDGAGNVYVAPAAGFTIRAVDVNYAAATAGLYDVTIGYGSSTVTNSVSAPTSPVYPGAAGASDVPVHGTFQATSETYISTNCLPILFTAVSGTKPFVVLPLAGVATVYGYEN